MDGALAEVFDFSFREPTDFDVWKFPLDLEITPGQRTDLELRYALRDPGVSLTLEASQPGASLTVIEPLLHDATGGVRTLRINDLGRRFQERVENGRLSTQGGRFRFDARLLFTPAVEAVYPDLGLIQVVRSGPR
jgi:hypothetical protein